MEFLTAEHAAQRGADGNAAAIGFLLVQVKARVLQALTCRQQGKLCAAVVGQTVLRKEAVLPQLRMHLAHGACNVAALGGKNLFGKTDLAVEEAFFHHSLSLAQRIDYAVTGNNDPFAHRQLLNPFGNPSYAV